MSKNFESQGTTVWHATSRVAEIYMGYVSVLEGALSLRSGLALGDPDMDTIEVNREQLWLFVKRLLDRLAEEGDSLPDGQAQMIHFRTAQTGTLAQVPLKLKLIGMPASHVIKAAAIKHTKVTVITLDKNSDGSRPIDSAAAYTDGTYTLVPLAKVGKCRPLNHRGCIARGSGGFAFDYPVQIDDLADQALPRKTLNQGRYRLTIRAGQSPNPTWVRTVTFTVSG